MEIAAKQEEWKQFLGGVLPEYVRKYPVKYPTGKVNR